MLKKIKVLIRLEYVKKYLLCIAIVTIFMVNFVSPVFAQSSSYVLPYPSFMPGSTFYRPHLLWEIISKYFYFGSLGQFKYNLGESDKYIVEAKTLYEYGQYMYASNSLNKSNEFFKNSLDSLNNAQKENKNVSLQRELLKGAALKHIEVLGKSESFLPEVVVWSPEKVKPKTIYIKKDIDVAISIRRKIL